MRGYFLFTTAFKDRGNKVEKHELEEKRTTYSPYEEEPAMILYTFSVSHAEKITIGKKSILDYKCVRIGRELALIFDPAKTYRYQF